jgi:SAM-dependent methyltransferase
MKNRDFFYQQYDKINWENQEKTGLNSAVNNFIIDTILSKKNPPFSLFDIGSGIGFFIRMLKEKYGDILYIEGCEPSEKSFGYFTNSSISKKGVLIHRCTFQNLRTDHTFDFVTAIYVFPHFVETDLKIIGQKIVDLLNPGGKLIVVVSNEEYLRRKLETKKDLFIEQNIVEFNDKKYKEYLHYVEIPGMGTVIDYDREEDYYKDIMADVGLKLFEKHTINSDEYVCTVFVFEK